MAGKNNMIFLLSSTHDKFEFGIHVGFFSFKSLKKTFTEYLINYINILLIGTWYNHLLQISISSCSWSHVSVTIYLLRKKIVELCCISKNATPFFLVTVCGSFGYYGNPWFMVYGMLVLPSVQ